MKTAFMLAALAVSALGAAACGGDDGSSAAGTTTTETVETSPPATDTTTETTETAPTTPATPQPQVITIRVAGGVPQGGIQRPTIQQGEKVVLVIRTDSGDGVHLHGYDIEKHVVPGKPARIPFTATIAGRFELELHPTDTLLAVLQVQP